MQTMALSDTNYGTLYDTYVNFVFLCHDLAIQARLMAFAAPSVRKTQINLAFRSLIRTFAPNMTSHQDIEQMQAFSRVDGVWVAIFWAASFACFVGSFTYPALATSVLLIGAVSVVFAAMRVRRYRDDVRDGVLSFRRGFLYSMLIYLHAALLFAMVQYVYFRFLDNGFIANYRDLVSTDDFKQMAQGFGLSEVDWKVVLENLASLRPIDLALQFFTTNVFMGFFISVPVALIMMRNPNNNRKTKS